MSGKLNSNQIIKRIHEEKLVENYDLEECISPASYEMRVGGYRDTRTKKLIPLEVGQEVRIASYGFAIIGTLEHVSLANDLLGMMYLRSTFARHGMTPWFQGIVDPGYRGGLTVVLHNLTHQQITIAGGERICHLVFDELKEPASEGYSGKYQDSEGGALPAYQPPKIPVIGSQTFKQPGTASDGFIDKLSALAKNDPESFRELIQNLVQE
jgi:dCTP deaminase